MSITPNDLFAELEELRQQQRLLLMELVGQRNELLQALAEARYHIDVHDAGLGELAAIEIIDTAIAKAKGMWLQPTTP